MPLSVRRGNYIIPAYTLTGDLLAYLNCGLQYRYHNKGKLPPAIPVQLWFGEFLHGVLEEAYRRYSQPQGGFTFPVSWKPTVHQIEQHIFERLRAQGLWAPPNLFDPTGAEQRIASRRAEATLNVWGPSLFPLIEEAEVRLKGIRQMPRHAGPARADYYEVQGIVDVISRVSMSRADPKRNMLLQALTEQIDHGGKTPDSIEIIVDYKGMRRPPAQGRNHQAFEHQAWQVQTYAWLREQQPTSGKVVAGVLLYLNELVPSAEDMAKLQQEVVSRSTDVMPDPVTETLIRGWKRDKPLPNLPVEYRRRRSLRIVPVDHSAVQNSLGNFDHVVGEIEASVQREMAGGGILKSWTTRPEMSMCVACDARSFCPDSLDPGIRSIP